MKKSFQAIERTFTLIFYGMSTFTLYPSIDCTHYISSNEDITRHGWERTGKALQYSIDAHGAKYEK